MCNTTDGGKPTKVANRRLAKSERNLIKKYKKEYLIMPKASWPILLNNIRYSLPMLTSPEAIYKEECRIKALQELMVRDLINGPK